MSKRSRIIGFGSAGWLIVIGIAGAFAVSGTFGQVLALLLIGLGLVLATGLVFFEVGLSEDRERARDAAKRAASAERAATAKRGEGRLHPSRLGRMRGSRRRLR